MAWSVNWRLWDVPFDARSLRFWQRDRVREAAEGLIGGTQSRPPDLTGRISRMLGQELRDWVLRGGERFMPVPDQVLDTYWRAQRGLPGFYHPLLAGSDGAKYLGIGSIGDIGEGVALSVIESLGGAGLSYVTICRPIGDAPDFIFQDRADARVRGLAEVKSSEKADAYSGMVDAAITLLDVFRGWQRHRPLALTPGLAVAVHVQNENFSVSIARLRFQGLELITAKDRDFFDLADVATARKALWAGLNEDAVTAMSHVLSSVDPDTAEAELVALRRVQHLASATVLASRRRERPFSGRMHNSKDSVRQELGSLAGGLELDEAAAINKQASKLLAKAQEDGDGDDTAGSRWSHEGSVQGWRYAARSKADGIELRAYLPGDHVFEDAVLSRALELANKSFRRQQPGAQAIGCWLDGVEWTGFLDGRLQAWVPEVQSPSYEGERLVADAEQMLRAWRP